MGSAGSLGDSVESRPEGRTGAAATARATAAAAQRVAAQPGGGGGGSGGSGGGGGNGPLFGEGNCRCRSAVTMLGAATDGVGEFTNPPTSMVPYLYGDLASEKGDEQSREDKEDDDDDDDDDDEGGASSQAVLQPAGGGGARGNGRDHMAAAGAGADNRAHKVHKVSFESGSRIWHP